MKNNSLELYKKIYFMRQCELLIMKHYHEDEMKTPMHMSMGSEAISAGVCYALRDVDQVLGTYRSHALYLAKTGDAKTFFAEMYGKKSGCSKGKSGSMHLCGADKGHVGSSAVVGSHVAAGAGCAFSNKYNKTDRVCAVFLGDAAIDEGIFWETLNFACLKQLPLLIICENNGLAVHTDNKTRRGFASLDAVVSSYNCRVISGEAVDVEHVYDITNKALGIIRNRNTPVFLHLKYYRYLEHVGISEDFDVGYRDRSEFEKWKLQDPVNGQRLKVLSSGVSRNELCMMEKQIDQETESALLFARNAPFCDIDETIRDVFYENS